MAAIHLILKANKAGRGRRRRVVFLEETTERTAAHAVTGMVACCEGASRLETGLFLQGLLCVPFV